MRLPIDGADLCVLPATGTSPWLLVVLFAAVLVLAGLVVRRAGARRAGALVVVVLAGLVLLSPLGGVPAMANANTCPPSQGAPAPSAPAPSASQPEDPCATGVALDDEAFFGISLTTYEGADDLRYSLPRDLNEHVTPAGTQVDWSSVVVGAVPDPFAFSVDAQGVAAVSGPEHLEGRPFESFDVTLSGATAAGCEFNVTVRVFTAEDEDPGPDPEQPEPTAPPVCDSLNTLDGKEAIYTWEVYWPLERETMVWGYSDPVDLNEHLTLDAPGIDWSTATWTPVPDPFTFTIDANGIATLSGPERWTEEEREPLEGTMISVTDDLGCTMQYYIKFGHSRTIINY